MMSDIFLSYSRDDQATARRFAEAFEREGFSVWWDQSLNAGEAYDEVTEKALLDAKAVAVLWSKKSVSSRWVRAEATQAERNKTLVPAMIENCTRPIMFELTQTADLSNWSGDPNDKIWQAYLASVRRFVEKAGPVAGIMPPPQPVSGRSRRISPAMVVLAVAGLLIAGTVVWGLIRSSSNRVAQPAVSTATGANPAAVEVSLAVLPFVNMSSDPEQEYFSDGLSEELLNQLSKVPDLRVIGRTSSFAFKGKNEDLRRIGEVLGVNHLLEGSVRKAGNRVRINAQLIKTSDGSNLWSDTYERTLEDIFAIQEEIARTVVGALQLRMGTASAYGSGTKNVEAYDEFLAGRALLNSNEGSPLQTALPHLERAVALDPGFVPAWLWLIDSYTRGASAADPREHAQRRQRQSEAIDRVVALAPNSPEASFALSYRAGLDNDLQNLGRLLEKSLLLTGSQGVRARLRYAQFLQGVGRARQSVPEMERVKKEEPLDVFGRANLLLSYELAGQMEMADAEMQELLLLPGGRSGPVLGTAVTRAQGMRDAARLKEAVAAFAEVAQGTMAASLLQDPEGAPARLRQRFNESLTQTDIYNISGISQWAAYFGDKELALQALDSMTRKGYSFEIWAWMLWRPVMRDLRGEPGFRKLVRDLGIEDYWRATGNWGDFCKPVGTDDFECR